METITLTIGEQRCYEVMQEAISGRRTMVEAAQLLGVRERQGYV